MTEQHEWVANYLASQEGDFTGNYSIYEFGVYSGASLAVINRCFHTAGLSVNKVFGFDSFCGLPDEAPQLRQYNEQCWSKGNFSSEDLFRQDRRIVMRLLKQKIQQSYFPVELIEGFYEHSLKDEIVQQYDMKPALYVNVDCDLYISTAQSLDFLFRNNLINIGTIIRYDDWGGSLHGCKEGESGESKAHYEMFEKYGMEAELLMKIGGAPPHIHTIFEVK